MWVAADNIRPDKTRVVIISSGSVASIKLPLIVQALVQVGSCGYYREDGSNADNPRTSVAVLGRSF